MKSIVSKALLNSYSYLQYRKRIVELLALGKATGNDQSDDLTHYSSLNETRMHRLDKTLVVLEQNVQKLNALRKKYIWLVISEGWCGDAAQIVPVINQLDSCSPAIDLKIVFRDENPDLMQLFLTHGTKAIPKLIVLDQQTLEIVANWGPRPKGATELILNYKEKFGKIDEQAKTDLQLWYLHDKGITTQNELTELMVNVDSEAPFKM